jgi:hypothetical protein
VNKTKALMIAGLTALSLGAGTAMAQSQVPPSGEGYYFSGQSRTTPQSDTLIQSGVQSGSSDVSYAPWASSTVPFNGDYTTLANPG